MRAEGATAQEILDETGLFKGRNGLSWFFRNKTYLGVRKCGKIEVDGAHEPLIDRDTWDRVQALCEPGPSEAVHGLLVISPRGGSPAHTC